MIKKYLWILFFLIAVPCSALTPFQAFMMSAGAGGAAACATAYDLCSAGAGAGNYLGDNGGNYRLGTPWAATGTGTKTICSGTASILKSGSPTFNVSMCIYSDDGATEIGCSDTIAASSVGATYEDKQFTFSSPVSITGGTTYWVVLKASALSGSLGDLINWEWSSWDSTADQCDLHTAYAYTSSWSTTTENRECLFSLTIQ